MQAEHLIVYERDSGFEVLTLEAVEYSNRACENAS